MALNTFKHITVSPENYDALRKRGSMGTSFNDVITDLLKKVNNNSDELGRTE
jgi:predicted CopG family antitoxin